MKYEGKYKMFSCGLISTHPLRGRASKISLDDLIKPSDLADTKLDLPDETSYQIDTIAQAIVETRRQDKPVILFTGAHLIKNGLSRLVIDLVERGMITLVAGNCATAIHDFELALIGQTSENVPQALEQGQFGMAYEFAYFNAAISQGNKHHLGLGEALGRTICDSEFSAGVLDPIAHEDSPRQFLHCDISLLASCYQHDVPFTVHASIGTDVIDQHPSFDPAAKGGCSGRDFLIFTEHVSHLTAGGVVLNVGSAVTGPEVLLKAVSMAANVGRGPHRLITADFDLRRHIPADMADESSESYYCRDQKSIVTRIPQAFGGQGYYVQGNQKQTFAMLYQRILARLTDH